MVTLSRFVALSVSLTLEALRSQEEDMQRVNVSGGGSRWEPGCNMPNLLFANAFIRKLSTALPRLSDNAGVPVDDSLAQLAQRIAPLPTGVSKKGATTGQEIYMAFGGLPARPNTPVGSGNTTDAADYLHWIYPTQWITRQSPKADVDRALRTIQAANDNEDGFTKNSTSDNGFNAVFCSCAVLGMPIEQWLPAFKTGLSARLMPNYMVDLVSGLEGFAASDAVTMLLLQSWWDDSNASVAVAEVFPLWNASQPANFSGLRAKGGWALDASFALGRVLSPITLSASRVPAEHPYALRLVVPAGWDSDSIRITFADGRPVRSLTRGVGWIQLSMARGSCSGKLAADCPFAREYHVWRSTPETAPLKADDEAGPAVYWVSTPTLVNETVVIAGAGMAHATATISPAAQQPHFSIWEKSVKVNSDASSIWRAVRLANPKASPFSSSCRRAAAHRVQLSWRSEMAPQLR